MPQEKNCARNHLTPEPQSNIAMALDYQGDNDDILTVVFVGTSAEVLTRLFDWLCAGGSGLSDGYHIEYQYPPYRRQGYCYHRLAVLLDGYHEKFASPDDVLLLCQAWLSREVNGGHVDIYRLDDLLNLQDRDEEKIIHIQK